MKFSKVRAIRAPKSVSKIRRDGKVLWEYKTWHDLDTGLEFTSASPFTISVNSPGWDGEMQYCNGAEGWKTWDGSEISSGEFEGGHCIYMRGTGNTKITMGSSYTHLKNRWTLTGENIACNGNIEKILDYASVVAGVHPTMSVDCYRHMFHGCASLTTAPSLPATTLVKACYHGMFQNCTSLTTAPSLPVTTLAYGCYSYMFYGCTSLTTAPSLPATTLEQECYRNMFYGCTGLITAPVLPATTLAKSCYSTMFYGCTSLTTAPSLPATTLEHGCYGNMFRNCTSLTTAPVLPATTLAESCYMDMFSSCTSLTTAPSLPATTLATYCYRNMFYGCTEIKLSAAQTGRYTKAYRIPTSGTGTTATDALKDMFTSTGGTFVGTPEINTTYYLDESNTIV